MRWMMSCREAARLGTEASYRTLGPLERGLLAFHRSMCRDCRRFARQMAMLDRSMRAFRGPAETAPDIEEDQRS
jgi:hypothetical protein